MSTETFSTDELFADTDQRAALDEARRQVGICNACRYCEGYCAVFPAINRERRFPDGDITQLANLCHNCRGCYYACQYTPPHEFAVNLPAALAEVRQSSWERLAWPAPLAQGFHRSGVALAAMLTLGFSVIIALMAALRPEDGAGFYAYMSHKLMVAVFTPAFLLPLAAIAISLRHYWREVGGARVRLAHLVQAARDVADLRNLAGGQGQGCNFEAEERFSNRRRIFHQMTLYGFLMAFAATSSATVLHYGFGIEAPYPMLSIPKVLGITGGILLCFGTAGLANLKLRASPELGDARVWGGEMGFVLLLFFVSLSGLALYVATGTALVAPLLALHLGSVFTFFLLMPYSKMVHGFFRLAALVRDAQHKA